MKWVKTVMKYAIITLLLSVCNEANIKEIQNGASITRELDRVSRAISAHKTIILGFFIAFLSGIGKGFFNMLGKALAQKLKDLFLYYLKKKAEKKGKGIGKLIAKKLLKYLSKKDKKETKNEPKKQEENESKAKNEANPQFKEENECKKRKKHNNCEKKRRKVCS